MLAHETVPMVHRHGRVRFDIVMFMITLGILAFLVTPTGPLGSFWRTMMGVEMPMGMQFGFLLLLNIIEALAFGLGVSFLVFGYHYVRTITNVPQTLAQSAFLSVIWLLVSRWIHGSLYLYGGMDMSRFLIIGYIFNATLIIAGAVLVYFFWMLGRHGEGDIR
jgi:hypothetical protein